jgi:formylglycine-generating enzyme required for sulfatase activity/ABC-type phosphate transport system substrate-binding protein
MALAAASRALLATAAALLAAGAGAELPVAGRSFHLEPPGIEMLWIGPGRFVLGSPSDESNRGTDEGPETAVNITRGYWIGKTEVTQAQWRAVMGSDPSRFKGDALPVEQVSWHEAMEFARRLSERERAAARLPTGYAYALPTEAQWEFAAKAGMNGAFATAVDALAWHDQNTDRTQAVALKAANAWGLHDTLGNVWEWCLDWYGPYPGGEAADYAGVPSGTAKASRGGSWWAGPRGARPANRYRDMPHNANDDLGFRLALTPLPAPRLALAGTDTMAPMVRRWAALVAEGERERGWLVEVAAGPPPSAARALADATAQIGFTGRSLWAEERRAVERRRGAAPLSVRVAVGAHDDAKKTHTMAVFAHADRTLPGLTLAQLRRVFSGAADVAPVQWRELGVQGADGERPVRALMAKRGTGAANAVQETVLAPLDWGVGVQALDDDRAALAALAADPWALAVAGLPYRTPQVRALPLASVEGAAFVHPTRDDVAALRYPLARFLYTHWVPADGRYGSAVPSFLRQVLSAWGQRIALEEGYLPLPEPVAKEEWARVQGLLRD